MMQTPTLFKIFKFIQCFSFKTEDEKVRKVVETSLKYSHEEVNSRMLFHAKFINAPNTLVIRTDDTDVLVITLCNMPKLFEGLKTWLEVGLPSNNTLRYINVNEINQNLGYRPAGIYLLKVNNRNTRTRCEICSKLTIKTPERRLASFWCLYC